MIQLRLANYNKDSLNALGRLFDDACSLLINNCDGWCEGCNFKRFCEDIRNCSKYISEYKVKL